jgi:uncharacterized protein (DUF362 family)
VERAFRSLGLDGLDVRGRRVVLKPNLLAPSRDACTGAETVAALASEFLARGADVLVAESSSTGDTLAAAEVTGLLAALEPLGVPFKALEGSARIAAPVPGGTRHATLNVAREVMEADLLVSVPKLKRSNVGVATVGMKNMMGTIDRMEMKSFHVAGIPQSIADLMRVARPDLVFVDATEAMVTDGPMTGRMERMDLLIAGADPVAVDAAGARALGVEPAEVPYLALAVEAGVGSIEPGEREDIKL